jgi:hypothetical protein
LRYELGLCIRTGEIVWAQGSLPCGTLPDLRLPRGAFIHVLDPGESIIADRGYLDQNFFKISNGSEDDKQKRKILARHKTVKRRIKQLSCMSQRFRHSFNLYPRFFHTETNLTHS